MKTADEFLSSVESKAFRMAEIAIENPIDAMEVLKAAMIKWVKKYGRNASELWAMHFFSVLYREIQDFLATHPKLARPIIEKNTTGKTPTQQDLFDQYLVQALTRLPLQQQQVFMLSLWLGFEASTIAKILEIPENEVSTDYSRAVVTIKDALRDFA